MDQIPQIKKPEVGKESKEGALKNLSKRIKKLALLGVVFGGSFLMAQKAEAQDMKPGTVSENSMFYKMTEQESQKVLGLSKELDSLTRVLQSELKGKVPVTEITEYVKNDQGTKTTAVYKSYIYKNIQVGAEGSWILGQTGDGEVGQQDTVKYYNDVTKISGKDYAGGVWVHVNDKPLNSFGENSKTKESITFESTDKDAFELGHYTNKTGKENGGAMASFQYGDMWKEKNAIAVDYAKDTDEVSTFNSTTDAGKNLEVVLKKLKDNITVAISSVRESK
jgi:hypothetical protein